MLTEVQESNLTSGGDCREHYHLDDRIIDRPKVLAIQALSSVKEINGDFTVDNRWDYIVADTSSADVTVNLPLAGNGREIAVVKNAAPHQLIISCAGSDQLQGSSTMNISAIYTAVRLKAITGGWIVV